MAKNSNDADFAWNVGEWSELYVLAKLLIDGGAFGSIDGELRMESDFHKVFEVVLPGQSDGKTTVYRINNGGVDRFDDSEYIGKIDTELLKSLNSQFFSELLSPSRQSTFESKLGLEILNLLGKNSPSATSASRVSDLELVLMDKWAGSPTPPVGFSIKSQVGSPSTLLNASGSTNFEYEIVNKFEADLNQIKTVANNSVQKLVKNLIAAGCDLVFSQMHSESFANKLTLLDSKMVENVADLVINFYGSEFSSMSDVANTAFPKSDANSEQKIFKVKQFLGAIAMGLRPSGEWDGDVSKFKGMIIAKKNGDIVLYYVYNLNQFQDYLYSSVKFEVASTSRHKFGSIVERSGKHFIDLNLQIRFAT
jgi:hypothetical protein